MNWKLLLSKAGNNWFCLPMAHQLCFSDTSEAGSVKTFCKTNGLAMENKLS